MEEHLAALGVPRSTYAPPFHRALWRLGIEIPPPLFASYASLALTGGAFFTIFWGAAMWLFFRCAHALAPEAFFSVPAAFIAASAVLTGIGFGAAIAGLVRLRAHALHLPLWSEYIGRSEEEHA